MTKVILNKKISHRIANGHPWIFNNEVFKIDGSPEPGSIVEVLTNDHKFIGKGYFNDRSQIIVRLLTRNRNRKIDEAFFFDRISEAWKYRQKTGYVENCRL